MMAFHERLFSLCYLPVRAPMLRCLPRPICHAAMLFAAATPPRERHADSVTLPVMLAEIFHAAAFSRYR